MKKDRTGQRLPSFRLHASSLFRFLVTSVLSATATELLKFQTLSRSLLILSRRVIPTLALTTLKNNVIARHNPTLIFRFLTGGRFAL